MALFTDLPMPAMQGRRRMMLAAPAVAALVWQQLTLPLAAVAPPQDDIEDSDDVDDAPLQRTWIRAGDAPTPRTVAPASVWALANAAKMLRGGRFGDASGFAPPTVRIIREGGTVRCERLQPQETEEWREREQRRRAKQRPPKPVRKARTRGRKLLDLIGERDE